MSTADSPPASGSLPQMAVPSLVGQVLDNRYRITKLIGEGGMGQVYAAEHIHIQKRFAIKILRPEIVSNDEAVKRFRQEAQSSSSIQHRNIIAIDDFGTLPNGGIYMCMELLAGAPLNDMIASPQPPTFDRLLNILIQTGHGLAAAHAKHIVHRDMKPENIFVSVGSQGEDIPKILDFGIAKVSGNDGQNNLTRTGTIFGTPFYMAPEQALGNPVDARTDIYAMGVIAYEVFAGSLPFQGESFMGILTQHITSEPEPVVQRAAKAGRQLPPGLPELITRCMRKNPAERFQTMDELVNAFIAIYRGIAGPGMSTYMEAFPVGPTGMHPLSPTPAPLLPGQRTPTYPTGPSQVPTAPPTGPQGVPMSPTGTGPVAAQSYGTGQVPVTQHKKGSKLPLILVLLLLLGGGAGAAVYFLVIAKDEPGKTDVADNKNPDTKNPDTKNPDTKNPDTKNPVDKGSDKNPDPKNPDTKNPDTKNPDGSNQIPDKGSNSGDKNPGDKNPGDKDPKGSNDPKGSGDKGSNTVPPPPPAQQVQVALNSNAGKFEVWEDNKRLLDSDSLQLVRVTPGTPRTFVIKAHGFDDKTITVDGKDDKMHVKMTPKPGIKPPPPPPPPTLDCSTVIKAPSDKHCVKQYCALHPDEVKCMTE